MFRSRSLLEFCFVNLSLYLGLGQGFGDGRGLQRRLRRLRNQRSDSDDDALPAQHRRKIVHHVAKAGRWDFL